MMSRSCCRLLEGSARRLVFRLEGEVFEFDRFKKFDGGIVARDNQGKFLKGHILNREKGRDVFVDGVRYKVKDLDQDFQSVEEGGSNIILSPMPGKITKINTEEGAKVSKGEILVVMEAMKMEHSLKAKIDGVIKKISVKSGDVVDSSVNIVELSPLGEDE